MQSSYRRHIYTDVQYSIREAFKKVSDIPMKFIRNGEPSPFKEMPVYHLSEHDVRYDMIAKQRESVRIVLEYRVELFAKDLIELKRMQGELTDFILFETVEYKHHKGGKVLGRLDVKPAFMSFEYLKETNRDSDHYRKFMMIEVEVIVHKNNN